MNNTEGIEEALQERLSEIVNKDLTKRQVEKIVELFAPDKGNTITDEELKKLAEKEYPLAEPPKDEGNKQFVYLWNDSQLIKQQAYFKGYKANTLHRVVEVKSAEEILDQYWHYEAGKPLEHFRVLQAMEEYASQFKHSLPVSDEGWISEISEIYKDCWEDGDEVDYDAEGHAHYYESKNYERTFNYECFGKQMEEFYLKTEEFYLKPIK